MEAHNFFYTRNESAISENGAEHNVKWWTEFYSMQSDHHRRH